MNPLNHPLAKSAGFVDYRGARENPILKPFKEGWKVQAYRGGSAVSLTPEFFPFCRSRDEVREKVMERVKHDLDFRRLFKGYRLEYVCFNDCLEIK